MEFRFKIGYNTKAVLFKKFLKMFGQTVFTHFENRNRVNVIVRRLPSIQELLVNNATFLGVVPLYYKDNKLVPLKSKWLIFRWFITLTTLTLIRFLLMVHVITAYYSKKLDLKVYLDFVRAFSSLVVIMLGLVDLQVAWMRDEIIYACNSSSYFVQTYLSKLIFILVILYSTTD